MVATTTLTFLLNFETFPLTIPADVLKEQTKSSGSAHPGLWKSLESQGNRCCAWRGHFSGQIQAYL